MSYGFTSAGSTGNRFSLFEGVRQGREAVVPNAGARLLDPVCEVMRLMQLRSELYGFLCCGSPGWLVPSDPGLEDVIPLG